MHRRRSVIYRPALLTIYPPPDTHPRSSLEQVNLQASLLSSQHQNAATFLAHQAFRNIGVPTDIADSFGFTNRIVQVDALYRHGQHRGVTEQDVLRAVNNFVDKVQAPAWAHATPQEVRKLRMRLLVLYPQLMASHAAPDTSGHYRALDDTMSPLEAAHLATSLLYQKAFNEEYQLTDKEKTLDLPTRTRLHTERTNAMNSLVWGKSDVASMQDMLGFADQLFTDLGIESESISRIEKWPPLTLASLRKGGQQ